MDATTKINCKVHNVADGSKHLVFTVQGTTEVVGEIRVLVRDERCLPVISELFSQWARIQRGQLVKASVHNILNADKFKKGVNHG